MNRLWGKLSMTLLVAAFFGGCVTSSEPYSRDNTGYRYVVHDSPERALSSLRRWSNPKIIINFYRPMTPYAHRVKTKVVEVTESEITLEGDRVLEYTDYRFKPGYEIAKIPFSSIQRIQKETYPLPPIFWVTLETTEGEYRLTFYDGVTRNRFADALEIYLPYAQ